MSGAAREIYADHAATTAPAAEVIAAMQPFMAERFGNASSVHRRGEAAREAVERARTGGGPSVIEVDTCRFYGHHSGDAQLYRAKDEVRSLREDRDCLKHFRRRVGEAGLLDGAELDRVESEVAALIDHAVEVARAAPPPDSEALLRDVYVSY